MSLKTSYVTGQCPHSRISLSVPQTPAQFPAAPQRPAGGATGHILPNHSGRMACDELCDEVEGTHRDSDDSRETNGAWRQTKQLWSVIQLRRNKYSVM